MQAAIHTRSACRLPLGHTRISQPCLAPCMLPKPQLRLTTCQASASFDEDPYVVLGLKPDADQKEVDKAYNVMRSRNRGNTAMLAKIEAAHGKLMMAAFNARLKGGKTVPKEIKYADREQLFPWRPKRWDATPQVIMIFGALQLGMMAFAFQAPGIQKAMGCMLVGIAGNVMKQNAIFPPPEDPDMATEEESGRAGRNFVRGALLGLLATFSGILLFSAPEYIQQIFKIVLPIAPGTIVALKVAGSAIFNWIMTSYYY